MAKSRNKKSYSKATAIISLIKANARALCPWKDFEVITYKKDDKIVASVVQVPNIEAPSYRSGQLVVWYSEEEGGLYSSVEEGPQSLEARTLHALELLLAESQFQVGEIMYLDLD